MIVPLMFLPQVNDQALRSIHDKLSNTFKETNKAWIKDIDASIRETAGNLDKLFSKYYDTYVDKASDVFGETASALFSGDVAGLGGFVDYHSHKSVDKIMNKKRGRAQQSRYSMPSATAVPRLPTAPYP